MYLLRQCIAVVYIQLGFVLEQVQLRRTACHEDEDTRLGSAGVVRILWRQWVAGVRLSFSDRGRVQEFIVGKRGA